MSAQDVFNIEVDIPEHCLEKEKCGSIGAALTFALESALGKGNAQVETGMLKKEDQLRFGIKIRLLEPEIAALFYKKLEENKKEGSHEN
jgi:hypothetical protein